MSTELTIGSKKYTAATVAAKHFGYTKDYLLLRIKQGKIDGKKIGNKWYVHLPSAEAFFVDAEKDRQERRKRMSESRKRELRASLAQRGVTPKRSVHVRTALAETLVIMILGLSIGVSGYVGTTMQSGALHESNRGIFAQFALSFYRFVAGGEEVVVQPTVQTATLENSAVSAHVGTTTHTAIIVAPDELFTATTVEAVQEHFSDEVNVVADPQNPKTGIVTPIFKETKDTSYRFLMVPVTEATP